MQQNFSSARSSNLLIHLKSYLPIPRYPAVTRDIVLVVAESMTIGEIEKVIKGAGADILRDVKLFDIWL